MYFYLGVSSNQITHEVFIITPLIKKSEVVHSPRTVLGWKDAKSYKQ